MPADKGGAPIIIKRIYGGEEAGHHGGAWKVAYADFVTAMMAFFLLMWLINATTEKQRQGLAAYFDPTIVQNSVQGSEGLEGGEVSTPESRQSVSERQATDQELNEIAKHLQDQLTGSGAESMQRVNLLRHVVTRVTDEGLVIELGDVVDEPLFVGETAEPTPVMKELTRILATVLGRVKNRVAVAGHVRGFPQMMIENPTWALSNSRAHSTRELLEAGRLDERRIQRVTAFGDKKPKNSNVMEPSNNRIEVILLR